MAGEAGDADGGGEMSEIIFLVRGIPKPGGSKKAFRHAKTGKIIVTDTCNNMDWRTSVAWAAKEKIKEPITGPLKVNFTFYLQRPKGHYGTGRNKSNLKSSSPFWPAVKPDTTKLIRSTEDALTGIAWADDAQIVHQTGIKAYGVPGCEIRIWTLGKEVLA